MERKIAEARRLIGQAQLAKLQEELAQAMAAFEVGTPTDVLERMREKVQERLARAQARAEVAATDINSRMREIKRATASIGVEERLLEYKRQLGMLPEPKETEKTMLPQPEQQSEQTRPMQ